MSRFSELNRFFLFLHILSLTLILIPRLVYSAVITLEWCPNSEPDLAGYVVYYGASSRDYSSTVDVGNYASCAVSDSGFQEGQTYYFAVTAYDESGNESSFSEEVTHTFLPADTDGDGISDYDEINEYGTDPYKVDTDGDGLNDGDELAYWGEDWYVDYDADGLTNLLDMDSDGDGFSDGEERVKGTDPADSASTPPEATWTDYRAMLTMRSNDDDAIGIMFRYQDADNYYRFSWDKQRDYRRLVKCENGVFTLLAEDSVWYVPGQSYDVEIVTEGTCLEVLIDGSLIFSVTDESFPSGTIALYSWYNRGSVFDDVLVEDLSTGTVLLSEDFNDGDYTGWTVVDEGTVRRPSAWSAQTGALVQSSSIYSKPTDRDDLAKLGTFALYEGATNPPMANWTDYRATLTMRSDDDDAIGIMFRYQDADNYYRFSWDRQRDYRRLVKCENGVFTLLAEDSVYYVPGQTYDVELVTEGTCLEVLIDGSLIFSVTDESFSGGTIALYSWYNRGSVFDDVLVKDLSTGTVLLSEDFNDGDYTGWTVVDEGTVRGPSAWSAQTGALVQSSSIYSKPTDRDDLAKLGTFALYE
ncbi:MAG: hypothetical protein SWH78_06515 [Thermodesulfobacteriota bacterium]|nr:hypothetical protein [Thermodesulfobacteriota bacterium]